MSEFNREFKRKITYKFYSLPLSERLNILINMGLIKNKDGKLSLFDIEKEKMNKIKNNSDLIIILNHLIECKELKE